MSLKDKWNSIGGVPKTSSRNISKDKHLEIAQILMKDKVQEEHKGVPTIDMVQVGQKTKI